MILVPGNPLWGQFDIGVIGGVPLNHFILDRSSGSRSGATRVTSAPRRYTVGPIVELRLRGPVGLETGALYKRFGFERFSTGGPLSGPLTTLNSSTTGNSWEFPILAKLHIRLSHRLGGFLSAGPSIRRLSGITERGQQTVRELFPPPGRIETVSYTTSSPAGMDRRTSIGVAAGAGLELRAGRLQLAPSLRLTRWDTERTSSQPAASRLGAAQAEALLGLSYVAAGGRETESARIPCCFEFGALAGAPLLAATDIRLAQSSVPRTIDALTRRYAAGAFVDWRFHSRLSIEAGFLARRFGHTETITFSNLTQAQSLTGYCWEVPLLLKAHVARIRSANLYLGGGPALRRASHIDWIIASGGGAFPLDGTFIGRSSIGVAAAGGLEVRAGAARFRMELRYSWFERPLYDLTTVRTRQDSLSLIVGLSRAATRP